MAAPRCIEQSGRRDSNSRLLAPKAARYQAALRPVRGQCRDELRRDDDHELPWPMDALDTVQLDVARRRGAGDEHDRAALARARLEGGDQLGHRLDDRRRPGSRRRAGRARGSAPGGPGPGPPSRAIVPVTAHPAAHVVSAPSSASSSRGDRPSSSMSSSPAGRSARSRSGATPTRRAPAAANASAAARCGSSVTTTVAR